MCIVHVQVYIFTIENNHLRIVSDVAGEEVSSCLAIPFSVHRKSVTQQFMCVCVCVFAAGILLWLQCLCGGCECRWFVRSVGRCSTVNGRSQGGGESPCVHQSGAGEYMSVTCIRAGQSEKTVITYGCVPDFHYAGIKFVTVNRHS